MQHFTYRAWRLDGWLTVRCGTASRPFHLGRPQVSRDNHRSGEQRETSGRAPGRGLLTTAVNIFLTRSAAGVAGGDDLPRYGRPTHACASSPSGPAGAAATAL